MDEFGPSISSEKNWPDAKNNLDSLKKGFGLQKTTKFVPLKLPSTCASAASEPYQPRIVALFGTFFGETP